MGGGRLGRRVCERRWGARGGSKETVIRVLVVNEKGKSQRTRSTKQVHCAGCVPAGASN